MAGQSKGGQSLKWAVVAQKKKKNILGDVSKCIQAYNTKLLERIVFFGLCPLYNVSKMHNVTEASLL
jgi:hypothetical protein